MMGKECLLAKILIVSEDAHLDAKYDEYLVPDQRFYLFESTCVYDPISGSYKGRKLLHEHIIRAMGLPDLEDRFVNYVSIDIRRDDKSHTYLSKNRRGYLLSESQIDYICDQFKVDYRGIRRS